MPPAAPLPLSISIVTKDAAHTITRTLDSVQGLASEIIALDSGSTDGTIDLLRARGATVIDQPWLGYVEQCQRALDQCSQPWVLHIDSDESLEPALRSAIEQAVRHDDPNIAGYEVNRKVWYAGRFLKHAWQPEWRLRLVRRDQVRWGGFDPHGQLEVIGSGRVERLTGDMRHDSIATGIANFLAKQAFWARSAARAQSKAGRRGSVMRLIFSPISAFTKQIIIRSAWRDGWRGWVAASATSIASAMKHAALIEESHQDHAENKP